MTAITNAPIDDRPSALVYASVLWRRRWTVIITMLVAVAASVAYSVVTKPTYQATADLLLAPALPSTIVQANDNFNTPAVDVPTSIQVIQSTAVQDIVARKIPSPPAVTATQVGLSNVVSLTVESHSAATAARAATAYASAYITFEHDQVMQALQTASTQLQQRLQTVQSTINSVSQEVGQSAGNSSLPGVQAELAAVQSSLQAEQGAIQSQLSTYGSFIADQAQESGQILTPATVPSKPAKPKALEYSVLAGILGIVLGIGIALLLESFGAASVFDLRLGETSRPAADAPPQREDAALVGAGASEAGARSGFGH